MRINQIRKRLLMLMVMVSLSFVLVGCKSKYGSIPNEQEVLDEMSKVVEQENYELVDKEEKDTRPKECVYYFKSTDRDLEFTATATLKRNTLLGTPTADFVDKISNNYAEAVKELYTDEIVEILKKSDLFNEKKISFKIRDEEQYNEVMELLYSVEQIYSQESEYNSEKWMEENPVMFVELDFEIDGVYYFGSKYRIIGTTLKDDVVSEMEYCRDHAEKFRTEAD